MKKLTAILFIALSMTGISLATVGKAPLTPFHLLMFLYIGYVTLFSKKSQLGLPVTLLALGGFFLLNNALNYPAIRLTSLVYSIAFVVEMILLYNLLKYADKASMKRIFVVILALFFVNIVLATFALGMGYSTSLFGGFIGITQITAGSRPCGFSSEPSYAAFVVSICFLCWNRLHEYCFNKTFLVVAGMYVLSVALLGSAYGIILALVVILDSLRHYFGLASYSLKLGIVLLVTILGISLVNIVQKSDNETIMRLKEVSEIISDKEQSTEKMMLKLQKTDPSAFARIGVPYYLFKDEKDIGKLMLGKGAGAAGEYIPRVMAGFVIDEDDDEFDTGIVPAFIFDYGYIGFALLLIFVGACFRNLPFTFWIFFILMLPNANINTQLFWFMVVAFLGTSLFMRYTSEKYSL